jgi:hypothetical protein
VPYCTNCGTLEQENQQFCAVCGAPRPDQFDASRMPPMPSIGPHEEARVLVGISMDPPHQSRWSILFRLVLSLPLFVVVAGIGFATFFVVIAAWFCALVNGSVPDSLQRFLTNALRLYGNVQSYVLLLGRRWPGFAFDAKPGEQLNLEIDHVALRRWSVFFRFVLGYPAAIVGSLLTFGLYPLLVVMWIWGIIAGREPRALHQAVALVLRYQIRLQAYSCLLTPTQPFRGIFGDKEVPTSIVATNSSVGSPSTFAPQAPQPGSSVDLQSSSSLAPVTTAPLPTRWIEVKAAKVVLILVLVISVAMYVLTFSIDNSTLSKFKEAVSRSLFVASHSTAITAMSQFEETANSCPTSASHGCISHAAARAYLVLNQQSSLLDGNFFVPTDALSQARRYESALRDLEREMLAVENPDSVPSPANVVNNELPATLAQLNSYFQVLRVRLGG